MFRRHTTAIGAAIALCAATAGCGAATRPGLGSHAETRLRSQLGAVRAAAGSGDRGAALRALSSFATLVGDDAAAGELTAAERAALQTGIARTRAEIVATIPLASGPSTSTGSTGTTSTPTAPARHGPPPGHGHGPPPGHLGHGHGPGRGGPGDGGDGQGDNGG